MTAQRNPGPRQTALSTSSTVATPDQLDGFSPQGRRQSIGDVAGDFATHQQRFLAQLQIQLPRFVQRRGVGKCPGRQLNQRDEVGRVVRMCGQGPPGQVGVPLDLTD